MLLMLVMVVWSSRSASQQWPKGSSRSGSEESQWGDGASIRQAIQERCCGLLAAVMLRSWHLRVSAPAHDSGAAEAEGLLRLCR